MSTILEVEHLARELHEAGRVAVEAGQTVAAEKFGEKTRKFIIFMAQDTPIFYKWGRNALSSFLFA